MMFLPCDGPATGWHRLSWLLTACQHLGGNIGSSTEVESHDEEETVGVGAPVLADDCERSKEWWSGIRDYMAANRSNGQLCTA